MVSVTLISAGEAGLITAVFDYKKKNVLSKVSGGNIYFCVLAGKPLKYILIYINVMKNILDLN